MIALTFTWMFLFSNPWIWSDGFPSKATCEIAREQTAALGYRTIPCELKQVGP